MSEEKRQTDFATRLRRIQDTRQNPDATQPEMVLPPAAPSPYDIPQENYFVRNTLIWLVLAAIAGAGGVVAYKAIPQELKDTIAWITGNDDPSDDTDNGTVSSTSTETSETAETQGMSDQGAALQSPLVASLQSDPITLTDIASGVVLPSGDMAVGNIISFERNASCTLRSPLAAEKIMNVRLETGLLPSPIQAFSDAQLSDQLIKNVSAVTQDGQRYDPDAQINGALSTVDVFVTDTSAPIYLVLQNMGSGILWNIHAGPDVTVAHVAIVSSSYTGLVSPPNNATFDALLVSDFVTPHEPGADDEIRDCMIRPWRRPQPDWPASQKAKSGNVLYEDQIASYTAGYAAYNSWYTATLGVDAGANVVAPRDAAHVLVGPVPTSPISYQYIAGRDIHIMRTDTILSGDTATRAQQTNELHTQRILAAVGGDLSDLNPQVVERTNQ